MAWALQDRKTRAEICSCDGLSPVTKTCFFFVERCLWSWHRIQEGSQEVNAAQFQINAILNKQLPEPSDNAVASALNAFLLTTNEEVLSFIRIPIIPIAVNLACITLRNRSRLIRKCTHAAG